MSERPSFTDQLGGGWDAGKFVCVGLDVDINHSKFPPHLKEKDNSHSLLQTEFACQIIDATADLVLAYKPNIAFFAGYPGGEDALADIVGYIHHYYPGIPVIGDLKRADIANTNAGYAREAFGRYGFDAVTTNPYFGQDTYAPFLAYPGRGLIAMCKTTNPGAAEYQDVIIDLEASPTVTDEEEAAIRDLTHDTKIPLYYLVAYRHGVLARENPNLGIVVGATHPEAFEPVRRLAGDITLLIPGIGTQGGDLEKTLTYAPNSKGQGVIINSASGIIFASSGEDFAEAAKTATSELDQKIRNFFKAA